MDSDRCFECGSPLVVLCLECNPRSTGDRTRGDVITASWQGLVVGAVLAAIVIHLF